MSSAAESSDLLLALDIGNTSVSFGLFCDQTLIRAWQAHHDTLMAGIEQLQTALSSPQAVGKRLAAIRYCSVSPPREQAVLARLASLPAPHGTDARPAAVPVIPGQTPGPVSIAPYPPDQLGPDRWVSLCAAHTLYPARPVLVADFGTATTFDLVDATGQFVGGVIAPGLQTFWECLPPKTARLQPVAIAPAPDTLGQSTQACLQGGLAKGYVAMTQGLLRAIAADYAARQEDDTPLMVIATGGWAQTVQTLAASTSNTTAVPLAPVFDVLDPYLTLRGLAQGR